MPDTTWVTRTPGQFSAPVSVAIPDFEETTLLLGDLRVPDRVRTPDDMPDGLGGLDLRVVASVVGPCPGCPDEPHEARRFLLERHIAVAECVRRGFLWFRV